MSALTAAPLNIRRPLGGPRAAPASSTDATAEESGMHDGQQQTNLGKGLVPVNATKKVSDAEHAAAENAQTERPPHALGNDCRH